MMDQHICIIYINSVHKPLLLIFILRDKIINIDSTISLSTESVILQSIRVTEPLLYFMLIVIKIWILLVDFIEVCLDGRDVDKFIDIVSFINKIVDGTTLDIFEQFQIIAKRKIWFSDKTIPLYFAHHKINDFIVYNPMFFLIDVISINYFLSHMFVQLCEVDYKIENNWQILILEIIDCLSYTILICDKISLFEVYFLLYDILQRVENLLLNL